MGTVALKKPRREKRSMQFSQVAEAFKKIEETSGRLEMTDILAELLKKSSPDEAKQLAYFSQGLIAPTFEGTEVGMGEKFVEQAIALASGHGKTTVEKEYQKTGDLGLVAEKMLENKKQTSLYSEELSLNKVFSSLVKIGKTSGQGSQEQKIKMLAELLNNASPVEARYIARMPVNKLRLGIGDPTVLDALSVARKGDKSLRPELERAYNLCSDLGRVAFEFVGGGEEAMRKFTIQPMNPIRPALAERLASAEEIIEKIGRCRVEAKYDGFRCQVHKNGEKVEIFSRRLERMTAMFPELVEAVKKINAKEAVFEGEALAYNEESGEYQPFQTTIQRKRKHGVKEMAEEFPLRLFAFELLYADGRDYTREPYAERRRQLERIIAGGTEILMSESIETENASELEKFFEDCVSRGLEGIIAKDLKQPYVAGARKFAWIKLKRSYKGELADTIDVVVIGYYRGKGARSEFKFGGLLTAVYEEQKDVFRTIAKIGTGFSEEQMKQFQELLSKETVKKKPARVEAIVEPDFWVEPLHVVTVRADEISRSPMHTCGKSGETPGFALRFPRIVSDGVRQDKKPEDATTEAEVYTLFEMQKKTKTSEEPAEA